jgi:hypothetical protein
MPPESFLKQAGLLCDDLPVILREKYNKKDGAMAKNYADMKQQLEE